MCVQSSYKEGQLESAYVFNKSQIPLKPNQSPEETTSMFRCFSFVFSSQAACLAVYSQLLSIATKIEIIYLIFLKHTT